MYLNNVANAIVSSDAYYANTAKCILDARFESAQNNDSRTPRVNNLGDLRDSHYI